MENTVVACECTTLDVKVSFELTRVVSYGFYSVVSILAEDFKKLLSEQGGFPTTKSLYPITL